MLYIFKFQVCLADDDSGYRGVIRTRYGCDIVSISIRMHLCNMYSTYILYSYVSFLLMMVQLEGTNIDRTYCPAVFEGGQAGFIHGSACFAYAVFDLFYLSHRAGLPCRVPLLCINRINVQYIYI
jgi:hypothetical protein